MAMAGLGASLEAPHGVLQELEVDRHELGHERLQVVDGLVALLQPVLVECSDLRRGGINYRLYIRYSSREN